MVRDIEIVGAGEQYFGVKGWEFDQGRPFSAQEGRAGQPVVVLGHELAERLFEGSDPIGREVKIRNLPYRVIGVAGFINSSYINMSSFIFITVECSFICPTIIITNRSPRLSIGLRPDRWQEYDFSMCCDSTFA